MKLTSRLTLTAVATLGALVAHALEAQADEPVPSAAGPGEEVPVRRTAPTRPTAGSVWFENSGMLRFRPTLLMGGNLGLGNGGPSPVPLPLEAKTGDAADATSLAWADLRLRWSPTLHLGDQFSVHLGIDVVDGLVLGSTWADAGGLAAMGFESEAAASPSSGRFGWRDAMQVRSLYARWLAFDTFELVVGRVPDRFGLGLVRNDGGCEECDRGTIVDMVSLAFTLSGFRLQGTWEYTAVGATSDLAFAADRGAGGQPTDLGEADDVTTYTVRAGRFAVSAAEKEARRKMLDEDRLWAFDWALFTAFTDQTASSSEQLGETSLECKPEGELADGQPIQPYACIQLFKRGAFFWRPGFWFKAERHPNLMSSLRVELEAAALIGDIAHPQRLLDADSLEAKTFQGFGAALEVEWKNQSLGLGLDSGFATGDDGQYLGILDGQNVVDPDDDAYATNDALRKNRKITSFWFARDYLVDLILFREILGGVTNAFYLKPWVSKTVLDTDAMTLSLRLDGLYALATRPSGTPGKGDQWGIELDGRAILELRDGFRASLGIGGLFPLDALDDPDTGKRPDPVFAARATLGWVF
ncbi:MAG: hypothetical protein U1F43_10790 [Myxococcota bacterium]